MRQNQKQTSNDKDFQTARYWAVVGFAGNFGLAILKGWAGIVSNSSAMVADAVHSASDIFASVFVYISLKIAQKPADKEHPYGHGRAEVISTLVVVGMLAAAGVEIIRTAITTIRHGSLHAPGDLAVYVAILSVLVNELMYQFTYRAGVKTNSPSTIANAMDNRSDAFSSIAALIGIVGAKLKYPVLDPIAGIVVALFIFKMSYDIAMDAVGQIMDESVGEKKIQEVTTLALTVNGVRNVHGIRVRQSGAAFLVDLDIVVDPKITVQMAHDIGESVREMIRVQMDKVSDVRVHIDPSDLH
ncbi:cation diffusion facilitator family transporter [uncultured Desulfobacter sp.]|uniref:cation diffusion facilitator family transporter n=1 Tax=uncultured Desulfobacter sp. TaxID=240139 RepID=UPI0029F54E38|nr:cation diffusion facilitator family transporter [uncultured Desulfobacter sp.]